MGVQEWTVADKAREEESSSRGDEAGSGTHVQYSLLQFWRQMLQAEGGRAYWPAQHVCSSTVCDGKVGHQVEGEGQGRHEILRMRYADCI